MHIDLTGQMLSENELEELDDFLLSDETPENCMDISMLDGFLAAVVLTPLPVLPSQWLPWVWDMENGEEEPDFNDLEQGRRILGYLMLYYNLVLASVEGDWFEPLLLQLEQPDGSEFYDAESWCLGFIVGTALFPRYWEPVLQNHGELITPMYLLGTESGWEILEQSGDEKQAAQDAYEAIPAAVAALHDYFKAQREQPSGKRDSDFDAAAPAYPFQQNEVKIGRNDPCPCGSGKKFKKCCGAPDKLH
jgi:uncharacterized protein